MRILSANAVFVKFQPVIGASNATFADTTHAEWNGAVRTHISQRSNFSVSWPEHYDRLAKNRASDRCVRYIFGPRAHIPSIANERHEKLRELISPRYGAESICQDGHIVRDELRALHSKGGLVHLTCERTEKRMNRIIESAAEESVGEDHRVRVARLRREIMRARLLSAVLEVYPGNEADGRAVIDDVVTRAAVARSTFYKYFDSLDQAVGELGLKLADEAARTNAVILEAIQDPVLRSITAFQLCLYRAKIDPKWGTFVAHLRLPAPDHILMRDVAANFVEGINIGSFRVPSIAAAVNLVIDALVGGVRHVAQQGGDQEYIEALCTMVLAASGVSESEAAQQVVLSKQILRTKGHKLPWWR